MLRSPRRVAVVVLAGLAGYLLERLAILEHAVVPALLLGLLLAAIVPASSRCASGPD